MGEPPPLFCINCGGGDLLPAEMPFISQAVDAAAVVAKAAEWDLPWEVVWGFVTDTLALETFRAERGRMWADVRGLCREMLGRDRRQPPASLPATTSDPVLIRVSRIAAAEWSSAPLEMTPAFLGSGVEQWRFFRPDEPDSPPTGLVSGSGNVALTNAQHRDNAAQVIVFLDGQKHVDSLAPFLLWMLIQDDMAGFLSCIVNWLPNRTGRPIAMRALKRENWLALLKWLDALDDLVIDNDAKRLAQAWWIVHNFTFQLPDAGNVYGTMIDGTTRDEANRALHWSNHEIPDSAMRRVFKIDDVDAWWAQVLAAPLGDNPAGVLEAMYHIRRFNDLGKRDTKLKGIFKTKRRSHMQMQPPSIEMTTHRVFYSALVRAESGWDLMFDAPDWIGSPAVPEHRVSVDGTRLCDLLIAGSATTFPEVPVVPPASAFCMCYGPDANRDQGRHARPYDRRDAFIERAFRADSKSVLNI
jgi:hypothetical protein